MSKIPSVSVIILNYNGRDIMEECVNAVLKSTYKNYDVVIVDNASTDDSVHFLKQKYGSHKKIKLILSKKNTFFVGGFNLGARKALGDLILLLSNDVIVEPQSISELVKCMKGNKKYLVQPKILSYWNKKIIDRVGGRYTLFGAGHNIGFNEKDQGQYDQDKKMDYVAATVFLADRKFFLELGGYDEWYRSHYEDVDLCLRARTREGECWYCHKSRMYHKLSVTYKKYVKMENLLFDIRKNRLRTVIKNFKGLERLIRVLLLVPIYLATSIQDLLSLRRERLFVTIRSIVAQKSLNN